MIKKILLNLLGLCLFITSCTVMYVGYNVYSFTSSSRHKVFGASYMTMNNPYYEVINNEIKNEVEKNGDILKTLNPLLDKDKQNEHIYSFIEQKVDAIFVTPIDYKTIEPALQKAKEANIPVIIVDAPVYNQEYVACTIVSDNYQAGVQCAKDMMKRKKKARIMLLEHLGVLSAIDRIQGFKDTIKDNPNYKIINSADCHGQIELAFPATVSMLKETSDVDVMMCLNDSSAQGALAALEQENKDNVLVYGVDGTPDCKNLINTNRMAGTSAQYPIVTGQKAIEAAYKILNNEKVDTKITIPVTLITKENINDFNIGGWQ